MSTNPAWKTSLVVNVGRVLFIFVFSALLFMLDSGRPLSEVFSDRTHQDFLTAWSFSSVSSPTWTAFGLRAGAGLLAYALAFAACYMNMAKWALLPPLLLAMPACMVAVAVTPVCEGLLGAASTCSWDEGSAGLVVPAALLMMVGHGLVFGWYLVKPLLPLQPEDRVSSSSSNNDNNDNSNSRRRRRRKSSSSSSNSDNNDNSNSNHVYRCA